MSVEKERGELLKSNVDVVGRGSLLNADWLERQSLWIALTAFCYGQLILPGQLCLGLGAVVGEGATRQGHN